MAERKKATKPTASKPAQAPKVSDRVAGEAGRALPKGKATPKEVQSLAGEVERQREGQKTASRTAKPTSAKNKSKVRPKPNEFD